MTNENKKQVGKCGSPRNITITCLNITIMKVDLNVSAASRVVSMSGCSKLTDTWCGIQYRAG